MTELPPYYPAFKKWRDSGGLPALRPKTLPKQIPQRVWDAYRAGLVKPAHNYGVLAKSGFLVREPTGGGPTEKIPAVKAAGFAYLALNARDYRGTAWDDWRVIASHNNLPVVCWGRIYDRSGPITDTSYEQATDTVLYLLHTAEAWGAPGVILNIEDEAETVMPPSRVSDLTSTWTASLGIAVDYRGWVDPAGKYHGPDWTCVAGRAVGIGEAFNNLVTVAYPVQAMNERLHRAGFTCAVPMLGANIGRAAYAVFTGSRVVYTLDTVDAKDVAKWAA